MLTARAASTRNIIACEGRGLAAEHRQAFACLTVMPKVILGEAETLLRLLDGTSTQSVFVCSHTAVCCNAKPIPERTQMSWHGAA